MNGNIYIYIYTGRISCVDDETPQLMLLRRMVYLCTQSQRAGAALAYAQLQII
jgi:hypothetical protein